MTNIFNRSYPGNICWQRKALFFVLARNKSAGILSIFRAFVTQFRAKNRALQPIRIFGIASKSYPKERRVSNASVAAILLALMAAALMGGCGEAQGGYSFAPLHTESVQTVAVPIFKRDAGVFRREWETVLTEALVKRIELDTPYKVTSRQIADSIIEGRLLRIDQQVLSYGPDSKLPRQIEVTFAVAFTWKDLRSGKLLAEEKRLRAVAAYTGDGTSSFDIGASDAINKMALQIVHAMEKPW